MDDVKAMTRAGETVGKAVGSGWLAVRRSAKRAGQAGADATTKAAHVADRKLTERGVAPQQLAEALAEGAEVARQEVMKSTRRARKKLARTAKHTRKELAKAAKQARKEAKKSKPARQAAKSVKQARREAQERKASLKADMARLKAELREQAAALKHADAPKKRRRWPKVLLLTVIAAGVAVVVRNRATTAESTPVPEPRHRADDTTAEDPASAAANGQRPQESATKQG
jgi:predicted ATP-dependent protease